MWLHVSLSPNEVSCRRHYKLNHFTGREEVSDLFFFLSLGTSATILRSILGLSPRVDLLQACWFPPTVQKHQADRQSGGGGVGGCIIEAVLGISGLRRYYLWTCSCLHDTAGLLIGLRRFIPPPFVMAHVNRPEEPLFIGALHNSEPHSGFPASLDHIGCYQECSNSTLRIKATLCSAGAFEMFGKLGYLLNHNYLLNESSPLNGPECFVVLHND